MTKELNKRAATASKIILAYRRLFATDDGQIVLQDLMKSCHLSTSVIGATSNDTYFNEGARSVILRLLGTINMNEKQVERIIVEMNKESEDMML